MKNLLSNTEDLIFEITYQLTDQSKNIEDNSPIKVPNIWEENYLENEPVENRTTDFRVYYPFSINSSLSIAASPKLVIKNGKSMHKDSDFGRVATKFNSKNSENVFEFQCETKAGRFDKKKYREYVDFFIDVIDQSRPRIMSSKN